MQFLESELSEVITNVFGATLEMEVYPADAVVPQAASKDVTYVGILQVSGGWSGTALFEVHEALAIQATSRMLSLAVEQVEPTDIEDVISELANMIAGNIKAMLPPPSNLSLPIVARGTDTTISMPESQEVSAATFLFEGHPITVRLFQKAG